MLSDEMVRRSYVEPRRMPAYVLNLRPVEVIVRATRVVMSWRLAFRILGLLFGTYGLFFLIIWAVGL